MPQFTQKLPASLIVRAAAFAQRPEDVGLASKRLEITRKAITANVEKGKVRGAVPLIPRHGKIVTHDAIDFQDRASKSPMKKDSIFRIASPT